MEQVKKWFGDFFFKAMTGVALLFLGQLYGYVPTVQPIVELSQSDQEVLADFGSPQMKDLIESRKQQFADNRRKQKRS